MTTRIIVEANHGWPVRVESIDPKTGEKSYPDRVVPANEKQDFYIHSSLDLRIHEVQPDEAAAGDGTSDTTA